MRDAFAGRRQSRAADARQQADERQAVSWPPVSDSRVANKRSMAVSPDQRSSARRCESSRSLLFSSERFSPMRFHYRRGEQLRKGDRATFFCAPNCPRCALKSGADLVDQFEFS